MTKLMSSKDCINDNIIEDSLTSLCSSMIYYTWMKLVRERTIRIGVGLHALFLV